MKFHQELKTKPEKAKALHTWIDNWFVELTLQSLEPFWPETDMDFPMKSEPTTGEALEFNSLDCGRPKEEQNPETPLAFELEVISSNPEKQKPFFNEQAMATKTN